jgi:outer membrane protein assembly factor BamB
MFSFKCQNAKFRIAGILLILLLFWIFPAKTPVFSSGEVEKTSDIPSLKVNWKFNAKGPINYGPIILDDSIIFSTAANELICIDNKTGNGFWSFGLDQELSAQPVIIDRVMYIKSSPGEMKGISTTSGEVVLRKDISNNITHFINIKSKIHYLRYQSDTKSIELFNTDYDTRNLKSIPYESVPINTKIWSCPNFTTPTAITIENNIVYISDDSGVLHAVNMNDGKELWRFQTGGVIESPAVVLSNAVYFGSGDGNLYVLDSKKGRLLWTFKTREPISSSPLVERNTVYFGDMAGNFYSLNTTKQGKIKWKLRLNASIETTPVLFDSVIYIGSWDGSLYAMDESSGKILGKLQTKGKITSSILVINGSILFGSYDGYVYSIMALDKKNLKKTLSDGSEAISENSNYPHKLGFQINYDTNPIWGNVLWKLRLGANPFSMQMVSDHLELTQNDWKRYFINPASGKLIKQDKIPHHPIIYHSRTNDGSTYIACDRDSIFIFNNKYDKIVEHYGIKSGMQSFPAIYKGIIYFGNKDKFLKAYDLTQQKMVWEKELSDLVMGRPIVNDKLILCKLFDGTFLALNKNDGQIAWKSICFNDHFTDPFLYNGIIYIVGNDSNIYTRDVETGFLMWKLPFKESLPSSLTIFDGILFCNNDYKIFAINPYTGKIFFELKTPTKISKLTFIVKNWVIYYAEENGTIYAVMPDKKEIEHALEQVKASVSITQSKKSSAIERFVTNPPRIIGHYVPSLSLSDYSIAAVDGEFIYFLDSLHGNLAAFDMKANKVLWNYKTINLCGMGAAKNSFYPGRIYFSDESKVFHAIDTKTAKDSWKYITSGIVTNKTTFEYEKTLIFGDDSGFLYVLDKETGDEIWKTKLKGRPIIPPLIYDDILYSPTNYGYLYSIDFSNGKIIWHKEYGMPINKEPRIIDNKLIISTDIPAEIKILNSSDGSVIESFPAEEDKGDSYAIQQNKPRFSEPYLLGKVIFTIDSGSFYPYLYSVDYKSLKKIFKTRIKWPSSFSDFLIHNDILFYEDFSGIYHAFDFKKAEETWRYTFPISEMNILSDSSSLKGKPYINAGNIIAVCIDGTIVSLNLETGSENWKRNLNSDRVGESFSYRGILYVILDGQFYTIDMDTGDTVWESPPDNSIKEGFLFLANGILYINDQEQVQAIDLPE